MEDDNQGNQDSSNEPLNKVSLPNFYKENKYVEARMRGASPTLAAIASGVTASNAARVGKRMEAKPRIQLRIREALDRQGVNTTLLAKKIRSGLKATKTIIINNSTENVIDFGERRQYTKLALEALGELETGAKVAVQIVLPAIAGAKDEWGGED